MNTATTYFVLTLEVPNARAEAMAQWLTDEWALQPVVLQKPAHPVAWLEIYFRTRAEADAALRSLKRREGVRAAQIRVCAERDWLTFWRHHFKPTLIGKRLFVCPVWETRRRRVAGRRTVWVDPGASFGTGDHFTTRFCLEMLDRLCQKSALRSVLDVGTGSGILAIAAAKLGCRRARGVDHDALALRQARRNVALNRVSGRVSLGECDVIREGIRGRYEVVCANIVSGVLADLAPELVRAARRWLIVSGVRELEADGVADVFIAQGAREVVRDGDGEWVGMMFETSRRQTTRKRER